MSFEDNLQLALDPAASEQLPRELHLGQHAWKNGKIDRNDETPGFRKLRVDELRQLMRRLQAAPQHHVILLNLIGHEMGVGMMQELAEPIAALESLQILILGSKPPPTSAPCIFSMATGAFSLHFYTLQATTSARLVA